MLCLAVLHIVVDMEAVPSNCIGMCATVSTSMFQIEMKVEYIYMMEGQMLMFPFYDARAA